MSADLDRIHTLGRRVRWLDRYRRALSIVLAMGFAPLLISQLADLLGTDWPAVHETALGVMVAVITWWTIEVALAWLTAIWETQWDRLIRGRGLPRAQLIRKKD